jgi:hypothetical protein
VTKWKPISTAPENVEVETRISDNDGVRNVRSLLRKGRLWFYPDMAMHVYYEPNQWRELPGRRGGNDGT